MKPFQLPPWRKKQIAHKFREQDYVTDVAIAAMEKAMRKAVAYIIDNSHTEKMAEPTLNEMFGVSESFYRDVVRSAWKCAELEKKAQAGKKRLAASRLPTGIPRTLRDLEQVFRDKKSWPKIMRRSQALTERLRKAYLQKLRRKFRDLQPQILAGEISPEQAKKQMMQAWDASKSRVQTLYRTETTKYFAKTQTAFFSGDPNILGFLFDSVADQRRTAICESRHGLIFRPGTTGPKGLAHNTPSCHYGCRSHLIALANTPHNIKLLSDPARDPNKRTLVPLPPGWKS